MLLVGRQEEHLACKKLSGLMVSQGKTPNCLYFILFSLIIFSFSLYSATTTTV